MKKNIVEVSCLTIGALCFGVFVNSQTTTVAIRPDTAFSVEFKHPGDATGYRMWCDGAIVKNYSSAEIAAGKSATTDENNLFTYQVSAPGLKSGSHSCFISAIYAEGDLKGDPITIPIGNAPMKPTEFKVIVK